MMDVQWAKIVSWHGVRPIGPRSFLLVQERAATFCGRVIDVKGIVDDLPGTEKTCESCLKIIAREQEKAAG